MVKVSNSGHGAFLEASGRLVAGSITPVSRTMASVHEVTLHHGRSLYRLYGDWFVWLAGAMALAGFACNRKPQR